MAAGVSKLVYGSSASVYGPGGPFKEEDPCRPIGPYAASKLKGEGEVRTGGERGLAVVVVRLGTVFGSAPAMRFDGVANRFAYLVGVGRPVVIHGGGRQMRPLIHIHDASAVLRMCLADPRAEGETINAATMNPSVNQIAETLQTIVPGAAVRQTAQNVLNVLSFEVDAAKLLGMGFTPRVDLARGMRSILARWQNINAMPGSALDASMFID